MPKTGDIKFTSAGRDRPEKRRHRGNKQPYTFLKITNCTFNSIDWLIKLFLPVRRRHGNDESEYIINKRIERLSKTKTRSFYFVSDRKSYKLV